VTEAFEGLPTRRRVQMVKGSEKNLIPRAAVGVNQRRDTPLIMHMLWALKNLGEVGARKTENH